MRTTIYKNVEIGITKADFLKGVVFHMKGTEKYECFRYAGMDKPPHSDDEYPGYIEKFRSPSPDGLVGDHHANVVKQRGNSVIAYKSACFGALVHVRLTFKKP